MKAIAVAAAGLFVTACWKTEKPVVHACGAPGVFGSEPSEGAFTILPSRVPGLEITDASWRTRGGSEEFVYTELLSLRATLHASRTIPQDEIAVVYDAPGPHAFVDASLLEADRDQYHLNRAAPLVDSGGRLTVGLARELRSSWWIGPHSALTYCPRTVRAVPLSALVLTLVWIRNLFGGLAVVATGALVGAVARWATPQVQDGFAAAMCWFLLLGGVRAVRELQRGRLRGGRRGGTSDADMLTALTRVPRGMWIAVFWLLGVAAVIAAAWIQFGGVGTST